MELPAGAEIVVARVSPTLGVGELVLLLPDGPVGKPEPVQFLFAWEDPPTQAAGDASRWRHIGSWNYRAGSWQHAFVLAKKPRGS